MAHRCPERLGRVQTSCPDGRLHASTKSGLKETPRAVVVAVGFSRRKNSRLQGHCRIAALCVLNGQRSETADSHLEQHGFEVVTDGFPTWHLVMCLSNAARAGDERKGSQDLKRRQIPLVSFRLDFWLLPRLLPSLNCSSHAHLQSSSRRLPLRPLRWPGTLDAATMAVRARRGASQGVAASFILSAASKGTSLQRSIVNRL